MILITIPYKCTEIYKVAQVYEKKVKRRYTDKVKVMQKLHHF